MLKKQSTIFERYICRVFAHIRNVARKKNIRTEKICLGIEVREKPPSDYNQRFKSVKKKLGKRKKMYNSSIAEVKKARKKIMQKIIVSHLPL